jgi:protease-4
MEVRHGKYKSAVEFSRKWNEWRQQRTSNSSVKFPLNSVTADISKSRNISVDKLNKIANGLLARTPEMALRTETSRYYSLWRCVS